MSGRTLRRESALSLLQEYTRGTWDIELPAAVSRREVYCNGCRPSRIRLYAAAWLDRSIALRGRSMDYVKTYVFGASGEADPVSKSCATRCFALGIALTVARSAWRRRPPGVVLWPSKFRVRRSPGRMTILTCWSVDREVRRRGEDPCSPWAMRRRLRHARQRAFP